MPDCSLTLASAPSSATQRMADVVAFEQAVVEFFVDAAEVFGLPKSVASIYGIVFASPEPLSFAEIEERLDFSKGSVSQGLKVLREMGAIREVSSAKDRAERFTPDLELRALVTGFLRTKVQPHFSAGAVRLSALKAYAKAIHDGTPEQKKARDARLDKLGTWHRRGQAVIPLLTKFFG